MAKASIKTLVLSLIAEADEVAKQHEVYHEEYVCKANDKLYGLLSNMLAVCLDIEASGESARVVKEMRSKLKAVYNIKTQANSRMPSIVVRYIVRSSRKTAHVYGRVVDPDREVPATFTVTTVAIPAATNAVGTRILSPG